MPSIAGASTQQSAFGGGGGSMQISRTRDPLIDCPVVIIKGINKSLVGIIKDVNGHMCRIELQSGNKTVQINKTSLMRKECVPFPVFRPLVLSTSLGLSR
jgi:hypothetical protein